MAPLYFFVEASLGSSSWKLTSWTTTTTLTSCYKEGSERLCKRTNPGSGAGRVPSSEPALVDSPLSKWSCGSSLRPAYLKYTEHMLVVWQMEKPDMFTTDDLVFRKALTCFTHKVWGPSGIVVSQELGDKMLDCKKFAPDQTEWT